MDILIIAAILILAFMAWQLWRAKQFTSFKRFLEQDIKPQVLKHVEQALTETRSSSFPNSEQHIRASQFYWGQFQVRVLQYALQHELLTIKDLKAQGKYRFCQHLFHIEQDKMHHFQLRDDTNKKSAQ